jgi:hypothetical protein
MKQELGFYAAIVSACLSAGMAAWAASSPPVTSTVTVSDAGGGGTCSPSTAGYVANPTPTGLHFIQKADQSTGFNNGTWYNSASLNTFPTFTSSPLLTGYLALPSPFTSGSPTVSVNGSSVASATNTGSTSSAGYYYNTPVSSLMSQNGIQAEIQVNNYSSGSDAVLVGFTSTNGQNAIYFTYNHSSQAWAVIQRLNGSASTLSSGTVSIPAGDRILLQLNPYYPGFGSNAVTVEVDYSSDGVNYTGLYRAASVSPGATNGIDITYIANSNVLYPFWGTTQGANTSVGVTKFHVGPPATYPSYGARVVHDANTGLPLLGSNGHSIYVTDLAVFWLLDTDNYTWAEAGGAISISDGTRLITFTPNGINWDPSANQFIWAADNSNLVGNSGLSVEYYGTTSTNILTGGSHLLTATGPIKLPNTTAAGSGAPWPYQAGEILHIGGTYQAGFTSCNAGTLGTGCFATSAHSPLWATSSTLGGVFTRVADSFTALNSSYDWGAFSVTGCNGTPSTSCLYPMASQTSNPAPVAAVFYSNGNSLSPTSLCNFTTGSCTLMGFRTGQNSVTTNPNLAPVPDDANANCTKYLFVDNDMQNGGSPFLYSSETIYLANERGPAEGTWTRK